MAKKNLSGLVPPGLHAVPPKDQMLTEGAYYDEELPNPDDFRISATDTNGHSTRMWCKVVPGHAAQIDAVVQSRKFPYRKMGDLIRHAISRHLAYLQAIAPVRSVMGEVDVILEICRQEEYAADFKASIDTISRLVTKHLDDNSKAEAGRLIMRVLHQIELMPEGHWRDKYKADILARFGHLIKDAPTLDLSK